ncbi:MAG: hypothetical protein GVY30_02025 [Chloroflexi bacterium]|jgi:hypothetical protein|nr:hypothetical protein [Chloroflexota bacterium]
MLSDGVGRSGGRRYRKCRLFTETQAALEAEQRAYGEVSAEAWAAIRGYFCSEEGLRAMSDPIELSSATPETGELNVFTMPIESRGQVLGTFQARKSSEWASDEEALLESSRDQLGGALESARLYEDTQRCAALERLISEVATRMRESLDMEIVLNTAVREISEALELAALDVRLDL